MNRYKIKSALLIAFTFFYFFLHFLMVSQKSEWISGIVEKKLNLKSFILLTVFVIILHLSAHFILSIREFFKSTWSINEVQFHWRKFFPLFVNHQIKNDYDKVYLYYSEQRNRIENLKFEKITLISTIISVTVIYSTIIISDQYWTGVTYIPILTLFSYISGKWYHNQYKKIINQLQKSKSELLTWISSFFRGNSEIYSNFSHLENYLDWVKNCGNSWFSIQKKLHLNLFKKDGLSKLSLDLPFLICFVITMYSCFTGKLDIKSAFIWFGVTEYLMEGLNALRQLLIQKQEYHSLKNQISSLEEKILISVDKKPRVQKKLFPIEFKLLDQSLVSFTPQLGIQWIHGENGSGKSTLIEAWKGHCTEYQYWKREHIEIIKNQIHGKYRSLVSRPEKISPISLNWKKMKIKIEKELKNLSQEEINFWLNKFKTVFVSLKKEKNLSSGELFVFSLIRIIQSLDKNVRFIFIDEPDVHIDSKTRIYFESILELWSKKYTIFRVSHLESSFDQRKKIHLLACNKKGTEAIQIPFQIKIKKSYSSKINFHFEDHLSRSLQNTIISTIKTLIKTCPSTKNLNNYTFFISSSENENYQVAQTESCGLAFALAFIELSLSLKNTLYQSQLKKWSASGHILENGKIGTIHGEAAKRRAAQQKGLTFFSNQNWSTLQEAYHFLKMKHLTRSQEFNPATKITQKVIQ
ncbi:MAG: hypothetical protein CL678_16190 [Bdellovibrionaceae bacterium]|nr:hypothetical protein [Pseudobdellovibrionaceae bacterium]|tara:strand:+ start:6403 stop:8484 length:2082 start_codon:yes stop_codon:yes gene_type:complete